MEQREDKREIVKFDISEATIALIEGDISRMSAEYLPLKINGIDDLKGYKTVYNARQDVKKLRVTITKGGLDLRAEANKYIKDELAVEKRILGMIAPIEAHLQEEEDNVKKEKERIKAEAEAKEAARIQARIDRLEAMGMGLSGGHYRLPFEDHGVDVPLALVPTVTDEQFDQFCCKIQEKINQENERLEEIEIQRKAEADRLAKVAAEQEAERKRLEEEAKRIADEQAKREAEIKAEQDRIRKEQEQREAAIKAAQDAIEAEKKAIADAKQKAIDDARRAEELEQARKEAAEKARIEAEENARQEAERKEMERLAAIEKERLAKIAAEEEARRQEELKPDKEKLLAFADHLEMMGTPSVKNKKALVILHKATAVIEAVAQEIRVDVEGLK